MTTRTRTWKIIARQLLGKQATPNGGEGDGQFALVAPCGGEVSFSLWSTREAAEKCKKRLRGGCGSGCWPTRHYIVDLRKSK